jgi:hypothetical protein
VFFENNKHLQKEEITMPTKGTTNNPNGRPKGVPNKLTKELRQSLKDVVSGHIEQIGQDLDKLEPRERLELLIKILQYILPKVEPLRSDYDDENNIFGE